MPTETLHERIGTTRAKVEDMTLTNSEACRLIGICIELIDLCAKVTGKIDPAVGAIVGYARDEALSEVLEIGS
jgi:hypothetical protein